MCTALLGAPEVWLLVSAQRELRRERDIPPEGCLPFPPESLKAEEVDVPARLSSQELAESWHIVGTYRILT